MKTTVENLDPSRIKLTVEVPYEELKPSLDAAYKEIGSQIQVPGFRRGHVPNRVIDQRVGRGAVIQEAVNNKLSDFYRDAITEAERVPMLQPEVDVVELPNATGENGGQLAFSAEVTVRPVVELPDLSKTELTVDAVEVTDEDVDTELDNLRARFGSLKSVGRKAKTGDFVTIDLKAVIDGEEVDSISGVSYEIGKGNMLKGLDTALRGLKTDESATFTTELAGGEHAGEQAEVTVTATAVKQRELPNATGENGGQLAFTAEVTVRPVIELPDLSKTKLTVDAVEVTDEDVDTELDNLRARFGSLKSVGRKAKTGDFVTIDLKAVIDGEEVDSISGVSYEIGKGNMLKGLDTALRGLKTDESATFTTELAGGEHAGEKAEVTVTATAVKQRELPKVDDEFAQLASEFDTVEELREDLVKQVTERKTGEQAVAARDALLEHLRSEVTFDVPEAVVEAEVAQHLRAEGKEGDEEHAKEIREDIVTGVRDQIILDVLAEDLKVGVAQDELLEFLFQTAQQYGMEPAQFLQGAQQAGQIPAFVSEVARNKSLAMALRQASVVDSKGEIVDLSAFIGSDEDDAAAAAEAAAVAAAQDADSAEDDDAE